MTKIRKTFPILFIVFAFSLLDCASIPVYRLESGEKSSEWYYGRPVLTRTDRISNIQLTFEDVYESSYYFYIEVTNTSGKSIVINPADFYFENYHPVSGKDPIILGKVYAIDPEQKLISIDKTISKANSQENTRRGLSCLVSAVDFAGTVSKIGKKRSQEEIEKENRERENRRIDDQNAEVEHNEKINKLNDERNYWQNEAIRKTSIKPGMKAVGFFRIPIPADARYLKLVIPVESSKYEFEYKQILL